MSPIVTRNAPKSGPMICPTFRRSWRDSALRDTRWWHPLLGVVVEYRESLLSEEDVELLVGEIVDRGSQGLALGSPLVWPRERWRRISVGEPAPR